MVKYGFDNESEGHWRFPQLERQEGESMREVRVNLKQFKLLTDRNKVQSTVNQ